MRNKPSIPEWYDTITTDSDIMLLVIDMQNFFLTDTRSPWADPDALKIVPNIKKLFKRIGAKNALFTLFRPPVDWQDENKSWRTY